jgi:hypothetical protein
MKSLTQTLHIMLALLLVVLSASSHSCWSFSFSTSTTTRSIKPFQSYSNGGSRRSVHKRSPLHIIKMAAKEEDEEDEIIIPALRERLVEEDAESSDRRDMIYNALTLGLLGVSGVASWSLFHTSVYTPSGFQRLPNTQFIAALGDPKSNHGSGTKDWGLWRLDPGPRGVFLNNFKRDIVDGQAPAGWSFDANDWWLEEHGIIMEAPKFPLTAGRYLVTGGRMVTTGLTIDEAGNWKLDEGSLYDVTHLPCRSARYVPNSEGGSPVTANVRGFPVTPGAEMPKVAGCDKQDYAVLFLVGKEIKTNGTS